MRISFTSLALSIFLLCGTTAKVYLLTRRSLQKKKIVLFDAILSWILFLLNVLLLVFSVILTGIAFEVLLSLANGALIIYQYVWVWQFGVQFDKRVRHLVIGTQVLCAITICVLSIVLPSMLKQRYKAWHVAGISFFIVEYMLLEIFYAHMFLVSYRKPKKDQPNPVRNILLWNMALSYIAFIAAIPTIVICAKGMVSVDFSLWMNYIAASLWYMPWLLLQTTSKPRVDSNITSVHSFETSLSSSQEALCSHKGVKSPPPVHLDKRSQEPFKPNSDGIQQDPGGSIWSGSFSSSETRCEPLGEMVDSARPLCLQMGPVIKTVI